MRPADKSGSTPGKRLRNRALAGLVAAVIALVGGQLLTPAPAHAATGYIYVSMPTWLGNCPLGGSVKYVGMSAFWTSSSSAADFGDDLVYVRVGLRQSVNLIGQGICYKSGKPPQYNTPIVNRHITPTRHGQTFWVGPAGVRNN